MTKMKCLSVRQPWASLIAHGHKDVENRTWSTNYRGPLIVHASAKPDCSMYTAMECIADMNSMEVFEEDDYALFAGLHCPLGVAVCVVDLVDVVKDSTSVWAAPGLHHWVLENARLIDPVPMKGRLQIFTSDVPVKFTAAREGNHA